MKTVRVRACVRASVCGTENQLNENRTKRTVSKLPIYIERMFRLKNEKWFI